MNQQHNAGSMTLINQYSSSTVQSQISTSYSQQNQQHNQVCMLRSQQSMRATPPYSSAPTRAIMAAKQAEQAARAQASTGVRPTMQSSFPRPVNQGTVQRQSGASGGNIAQSQWANTGGSGYMNFLRQPGNSNMGVPDAGSNVGMQHGSTSSALLRNNSTLADILTKNPKFTAHVIKHNRIQNVQVHTQLFVVGSC